MQLLDMKCYLCTGFVNGDDLFQCPNCEAHPVFCSASHLALHSPDNVCLPWTISSNDQYGRYLVAARDISPGELVVVEKAVSWGPNHSPDRLCLECLTEVGVEEECLHCGFPLCSSHTETPQHEIECKIFQKENCRLDENDKDDMETVYPCVEVIRCLSLLKKSPEKWKLVEMLMDHQEERMAEKEKYIEPYRDIVINKLIDTLGVDVNEEEIIKVLGYLDVNSIAVRGKEDNLQVQYTHFHYLLGWQLFRLQ